MPLNPKQQRFVAEYLKDLNATQAAKRAGYSAKTAYAQGSALLKHPEISEAIAKGQERVIRKAEVSAEYVLTSLLNVAQRCQQAVPVMRKVDGELVQETTAEGEGVWEFDSSGANRALELLGKHLGIFPDKHEVAGPGGRAISISIGGIAK